MNVRAEEALCTQQRRLAERERRDETRGEERLAADAVTDGEFSKVKWGLYPNSLQTRLQRSKWLKPSRASVLFLILRRRLQRDTEAEGFSRISMFDLPVIDIHPCQSLFLLFFFFVARNLSSRRHPI